jgi:hypothetical protein
LAQYKQPCRPSQDKFSKSEKKFLTGRKERIILRHEQIYFGQMSTYELISEKQVKANKTHTCIWCFESILPSSIYIREISRYEVLQDHKWHPECYDAAKKYFDYEGEFPPGIFKRRTTEEK